MSRLAPSSSIQGGPASVTGSGSNTMRTPKSSWSSFCAPESSHSTRYVLGPSWITPTLKGDSGGGARLLHTAACGSSVPRLLRNSKLTIPPRLCALQVAPIVLTSVLKHSSPPTRKELNQRSRGPDIRTSVTGARRLEHRVAREPRRPVEKRIVVLPLHQRTATGARTQLQHVGAVWCRRDDERRDRE